MVAATRTVTSRLLIVVAAAVVPQALLAALLMTRYVHDQRSDYQARIVTLARSVAAAADSEMSVMLATARALSRSDLLRRGDLAGFRDEARAVAERSGDWHVVLIDAAGHEVVNTGAPVGAALPPANPEMMAEAVRSGQPVVTPLLRCALTGAWVAAVVLPIDPDGRGPAFLAVTTEPRHLAEQLRREHLPPRATAAVIDRRGAIVASTDHPDHPDHAQWPAAAGSPLPLGEASEGETVTHRADGTAMLTGFARAPGTGWLAAVQVPEARLLAPLHQSLRLIGGCGLALSLLAVALALYYARGIARAVDVLADATAALEAGTVPPPAAVTLSVVQAAHARIRTAAARLLAQENERAGLLAELEDRVAARTQELALSEQRFRRLAETARAAEAGAARAAWEAQAADRAKSEFLARMSHELRTPLNAVNGFAEVLLQDPTLRPAQRDWAGHIVSGARQLLRLIEDVLDLARIESGQLKVVTGSVDAAALIEEAMHMLAPAAADRRVSLLAAPVPAGTAVLADRARLLQVLLNLGANAIKYNRPGGTVRISVAASPVTAAGGAPVRFTVADDGPGIPAGRLEDIFQPLQRLDEARGRVEGTGMGLAITRQLVGLMRGSIAVESEVGQGARFHVDLPAGETPPGPAGATRPPPEFAAGAPFTVLYIEDTEAAIQLMQAIFAFVPGARLQSARTAAEGLSLARATPPDCIITDIRLPDMDGFALLARLRADPRTAAVPVVAVSGEAMPDQVASGRDAGFFAYITKPFHLTELSATLDALRRARALPPEAPAPDAPPEAPQEAPADVAA